MIDLLEVGVLVELRESLGTPLVLEVLVDLVLELRIEHLEEIGESDQVDDQQVDHEDVAQVRVFHDVVVQEDCHPLEEVHRGDVLLLLELQDLVGIQVGVLVELMILLVQGILLLLLLQVLVVAVVVLCVVQQQPATAHFLARSTASGGGGRIVGIVVHHSQHSQSSVQLHVLLGELLLLFLSLLQRALQGVDFSFRVLSELHVVIPLLLQDHQIVLFVRRIGIRGHRIRRVATIIVIGAGEIELEIHLQVICEGMLLMLFIAGMEFQGGGIGRLVQFDVVLKEFDLDLCILELLQTRLVGLVELVVLPILLLLLQTMSDAFIVQFAIQIQQIDFHRSPIDQGRRSRRWR